jgi:hypothetical protein
MIPHYQCTRPSEPTAGGSCRQYTITKLLLLIHNRQCQFRISHRPLKNQQLDTDCGSGGRWLESTQLYQVLKSGSETFANSVSPCEVTPNRTGDMGDNLVLICSQVDIAPSVPTARSKPPAAVGRWLQKRAVGRNARHHLLLAQGSMRSRPSPWKSPILWVAS